MATTFENRSFTIESKTFLNGVFGWMGIGMALTAFIAWLVYSTPSILSLLVIQTGVTGLGYLVIFAPLAFVLLMSFGFNHISYGALVVLFLLYAILMGASLSFIFLAYTSESIYSIFIVAAIMYAIMAFIGYTTRTDLTKMGSILLMALIGIIIASLINLFMKSDSFNYFLSFISIIIFCGLTAWDIQKLKKVSETSMPEAEIKSKLGILGALTLYLDFINLFLSLLQFFGKRRD